MGIDLNQYRARIGSFLGGRQKSTTKMDAATVEDVPNPCLVLFLIISILLLIGCVESNPGPGPSDGRETRSNKQWKSELENIQQSILSLKKENKVLHSRINSLESQLKKNNIVIYGINEVENESQESVQQIICDNFRDKLGLEINHEDIDLSNRIGKKKVPHENDSVSDDEGEGLPKVNNNTRPILCKFKTFNLKSEVVKTFRGLPKNATTKTLLNGLKINDDLTKHVRDMRRKLIPFMLEHRNRHKDDQAFKCFLKHDKLCMNGTLYSLNETGDGIVPARA